ncbi:MAG: hypothetical protein ABWZ25_13185 [Chitinophagaceae bacterium]
MKKKAMDKESVFLVCLCLTGYFLFKPADPAGYLFYLLIGVWGALCAFILYGLKVRLWIKLMVAAIMGLLFWFIQHTMETNVSDITAPVDDKRFYGVWQTDSTGGITIKIRAVRDSAFLTQTDFTTHQDYRWGIDGDTLTFTNSTTNRQFKWRITFFGRDTMRLQDTRDSLVLWRIK